ncbi:hypothetical protein GGS21DRAFT_352175 [Xylaria nigripes]|nr:hypothetical protein GGS21DRAFT_352175 [Xylaria nigripes]
MADRIMLRIRHLLPFPLSFRLTAHIPKLVPSFLGPYTQALTRSRSARLHATSYLDGLRGLAALIVCMCHYTETNHPNLTTWYGVIPNPALAVEPSLIQLPFIRVTFSGRPVVHVFFVISGFALSVKALSAIRAGDLAKCHATLASAAFRRPLRLCVPPVVSMVLILFFVRAGWLGGALGSWKEQIYDWVDAVYHHIIWPWSWDTHLYPPYNVNLWTIPIELCHSMLLFVMVLALSHVRATVRVTLGTAFVVYSLQCGKWAAAEFISGMLLAEAHLVSTERKNDDYLPFANTPPNPDTRARTWFSTLKRLEIVLHLVILTAALFIAGWPNMDSAHTPVIRRLASYAPQAFNPRDPQGPQKFWFAIGAAGIVWSCGRVGFLRETILKSRFAKYAGRVSFAVYIVHGPGE